MTFLADDLLEGRGVGTRGFELAAKYAASQFAAAGLQPAGVEGTYYQRVRFRRARPVAARSSLILSTGADRRPFEWGRDFVARGNALHARASLTAPIVFVGYGVSAPEYGHDDYAGDVRGAMVAFLPGVPPQVPAEQRDYHTSLKWRLAQQRGAVATIELSTAEQDRSWPWEDRIASAAQGAATWLRQDGTPPGDQALPRILLSTPGTSRLLATASRQITDVLAAPRSFRLPVAAFNVASAHDEMTSPHVLAMLPGGDPALRSEYVVYIAHLDGSGKGEPIDGDDTYNSAIDNGLGSAILLALAQTFGGLAERPKRSLLFVASTGEELGIQGSPYFVEHPTVPLDAMVAVINIDGPALLIDPLRSVLAMGAANSDLGGAVDRAVRQLGLDVKRAAAPLNYSDHYPFVMKGVPALWIVANDESAEPSEAREAVRLRIHKPTDDMNRTFRWDAAVALTRLNFLIGLEVANTIARPRWNPGDILGEKFGKRQSPTHSVPSVSSVVITRRSPRPPW